MVSPTWIMRDKLIECDQHVRIVSLFPNNLSFWKYSIIYHNMIISKQMNPSLSFIFSLHTWVALWESWKPYGCSINTGSKRESCKSAFFTSNWQI